MRIAINGFGRVGRVFFRQCFNLIGKGEQGEQGETKGNKEGFEIVAINDLSDIENLAYLLKYDSVYGKWDKKFEIRTSDVHRTSDVRKLIISGKEVLVFNEKDPEKLPWKDLNIDVVIESTGFFTDYEGAKKHLTAGAKKVLITAPTKDDKIIVSTPGINNFLQGGINRDEWIRGGIKGDKVAQESIFSNASCTTNAVNPVLAIMSKTVGVKKALLNTIHAYTATQTIVDGIVKGNDFKRGRAGAQNIIPSTTGAAEATIKVIPELAGKFDGISIRVPVISGSLADITFISERQTSVEEINQIFKKAEKQSEWQGILKTTDEQIVSSDILKEPYGAIIDLTLTKVIGGDLVKVFSWYDNEWGYCAMLIKQLQNIISN